MTSDCLSEEFSRRRVYITGEITDAMAATQAYSANVTMMNTLKAVVSKGMEIGR